MSTLFILWIDAILVIFRMWWLNLQRQGSIWIGIITHRSKKHQVCVLDPLPDAVSVCTVQITDPLANGLYGDKCRNAETVRIQGNSSCVPFHTPNNSL